MTAAAASEPAFSICVYCGSRPGEAQAFADVAAQVGHWIGRHGGQLVYGGGRAGLMGVVADATLAAGGRVVGIIPRVLVEREHAHRGCHELHVVETMHERKRQMAERADAFLALPGGIGTFEEFFETWTWRQLGYHDKPVGLLNQDGYYDAMLSFLQHSVASGFMGAAQMALIEVGTDWRALLGALVHATGFPAPDLLSQI
ncbi:MAG: TIGR00730 family Rossman fold protein [Rubrivivax sp.]|uniref:LOG family protein n=1 Tax=Ottowia sp. TaxID=1898956 RepID=UPI0011D315E0|nr:TIGR00730 family Rossman fold protein [Ottowia sp.]MCC6814516.1 TIGR00730 family Rossman fold protein [Rubrivivax sp.]MCZ2088852.1 TIGR00730 family Rossman fold protein [Burkholderiales bacterium]TXI14519.1 MAG: TIGR00730 family Rossman fold protein [Ottowia sp.]HNE59353.1 TIGR00730 family Rossman fold protein [Ottowia sp.]HNK53539.1 TIGR00730 family Rossman fold protein [Ottowia sp.]